MDPLNGIEPIGECHLLLKKLRSNVNVVICEYSSLPILAAENKARVQAANNFCALCRLGQEVETILSQSKACKGRE